MNDDSVLKLSGSAQWPATISNMLKTYDKLIGIVLKINQEYEQNTKKINNFIKQMSKPYVVKSKQANIRHYRTSFPEISEIKLGSVYAKRNKLNKLKEKDTCEEPKVKEIEEPKGKEIEEAKVKEIEEAKVKEIEQQKSKEYSNGALSLPQSNSNSNNIKEIIATAKKIQENKKSKEERKSLLINTNRKSNSKEEEYKSNARKMHTKVIIDDEIEQQSYSYIKNRWNSEEIVQKLMISKALNKLTKESNYNIEFTIKQVHRYYDEKIQVRRDTSSFNNSRMSGPTLSTPSSSEKEEVVQIENNDNFMPLTNIVEQVEPTCTYGCTYTKYQAVSARKKQVRSFTELLWKFQRGKIMITQEYEFAELVITASDN